jgi:outer membrane protein assembly factor BamB/plastocyanin
MQKLQRQFRTKWRILMTTHFFSDQRRMTSASSVRHLLAATLLSLLLIALAACGSSTAAPGTTPSSSASGSWAQANYDYANTRDATQSSISSQNVNKLGVAWTYKVSGVSTYGSLATSPLVVNGAVYLQDLASNVYAIDLQTGKLKWEKRYNAPNVGPNGPAVDNGKVFVESNAQTVAALDANTGNQLWSKQIAPASTQSIDQQIAAYNGTLYVSTVSSLADQSSMGGGGMGIIYALNEQTGSQEWSFNTVQNGNLWGNPQVNSGGGAWEPPAIDTSTGMTYWGTDNPGPFPGTPQYPNASSRPGPNLYTNSELAINRSGKLQWYQQIKAHDLFDADFADSPILTTATVNGAQKKVVIGAGKPGYVVAFDAQTGDVLWKTSVGKHQNDQVQRIPAGQTITVLPGLYGGVETPMALAGGVVYVPIVNAASRFSATSFVGQPAALSTGNGELDAIDVNTGKILWKSTLKAPDFGGATVAGDLVFTSTYTGQVLAFNRTSGQQVWSWQAPSGINSPLTAVGNTLLIPVGLGSSPMLVALRVGATGTILTQTPTPTATATTGLTLKISSPDQSANTTSFSTSTLTAPPGVRVTLIYTNDTPLPHDWHLFDGSSASAPSIAQTAIITGPHATTSVTFTTPSQPGKYYFQCDVHPFMNGFLIVKTP